DDLEARAGVLKDAPLHDAKWAPGELNQFDHATVDWLGLSIRSGSIAFKSLSRFSDFSRSAAKRRVGYRGPSVCNLRMAASTAFRSWSKEAWICLAARSRAIIRSNSANRLRLPARICSMSRRTRAIRSVLKV